MRHKLISALLLLPCILYIPLLTSAQTIKLEKEGRVYKTNCKVNGLKLLMFLDTGADQVTISALEAVFMLKNGYLSEKDILGNQYYQTASGDIKEGTKIILRTVEIGGVELRNVQATIVYSLEAPMLMGQSALSKLGNITIDYKNNTLTINNNGKKGGATPATDADISKPKSIPSNMIFVEGGTFQMGNSFGKDDEKPVHTVLLNNFYIGKYEVTVGQYRQFVAATGYVTTAEREDWAGLWNGTSWETRKGISWQYDAFGKKRPTDEDNHPVIYLTWTDATKYCEWLSGASGKHYRLPTEAQWEYAAKGGQTSHSYVYSGSNNIEEVGWCFTNGQGQTHAVGKKKPNELGIYDMTGNVLEYTADWYNDKY